ncbi:MAG: hypothetical protein RJA49_2499 [Actinomycetota bacterium]
MTSRKWMGTIVAIALVSFASHALAQGGSGGGGSGGGGGGTAAVGDSADLQLTGSASTNAPDPGSVYMYTFQVKNSGGSTATGVYFADPVPDGTSPNYATLNGSTLPCEADGASSSGGTVMRCNLGSLAKGASATVVVSLNAPQVAASIANSAAVGSATNDPKPANNWSTVNVTVKAPTGGVCKGGVCDSVPTAIAAPCAVLTSVSAPVGYYSTFAAVWNTFTVQSCSTSLETITVDVVETDIADGSVDYTSTYAVSLNPSQNLGIVLDNDFAPFDTTYDVSYTVKDGQGNVLGTSTVRVTTPSPR